MAAPMQNSSYENENTGFTPDDKIASLFQPDTLLSAQYFDNLRRKTLLEPEKQLMLAVLEDGIHSYQENLNASHSKRKRDFDEAADWIFDADSDWVFSFVNVCDALGLSPEYLRQGLQRWKERSVKVMLSSRFAGAEKLAG